MTVLVHLDLGLIALAGVLAVIRRLQCRASAMPGEEAA